MNWQVTQADVAARIKHYERMAQAGVDGKPPLDLGEPVVLWRRFRSGKETREPLPRWLAELALSAIPEWEPQVERAKIIGREGD